MTTVSLRDVSEADIAIFFEHQQDREANHMAAFTPKDPTDREAFVRHWEKIRIDPALVTQTIVVDDQVAGSMFAFELESEMNIGYWLGREFWGKGIATQAVRLLLQQVTQRPLYARTAFDNAASQRVLEKCGFTRMGQEMSYANGRGKEIEEFIFILE